MGLDLMSTSDTEYVVLDVETNGLKSKEHDLLSISIYKPDDGKEYNRLLPLDLNTSIPAHITSINGIRKSQLRGKKHLTQEEIDRLIEEFELDRRTILHYGALDERFIRDYFARHGLAGFGRMRFFNFKRLVCSSRFSDGSLTKDNLCRVFGIDGVTDVHSGMNDCKLEWQLFSAMGGHHILAKMVSEGYQVEILSPDYIVPVSYLVSYPNLSRAFDRPHIQYETTTIFEQTIHLDIPKEDIDVFILISNAVGIVIEHLINTTLKAEKVIDYEFLRENRARNVRIGSFEHNTIFIPTTFNPDGTVTMSREEDKVKETAINTFIEEMRGKLAPLIRFIRDEVLGQGNIRSQELVVHEDMGILALCDLSTDDAVLEIKTYLPKKLDGIAEQVYYEAKGRKAYLLAFDRASQKVDVSVREMNVFPGEKPNGRRMWALKSLRELLNPFAMDIVEYLGSTQPVTLRCMKCGTEWQDKYWRVKGLRSICPSCYPTSVRRKEKPVKRTAEEKLRERAERYVNKVADKSGGQLSVDISSYKAAKAKVEVTCTRCGNIWHPRADHLLETCFCKKCGRPDAAK